MLMEIDANPPPEFVAVTMNEYVDVSVVGVPEIIPVERLKLNPLGSDGVVENDTTLPCKEETFHHHAPR